MQITNDMHAETLPLYTIKGQPEESPVQSPLKKEAGSARIGPVRAEGIRLQAHSRRSQARFSPVNWRPLATGG